MRMSLPRVLVSLLLLLLLRVVPAFALSGVNQGVCLNGTCDTANSAAPVAKGGTGVTTSPDDNILVGNGSVFQLKALTNCTGTGKAVTYDVSSNTFGCNTISGATPPIPFAIGMEITTSQTLYAPLGGGLDPTEAVVAVPLPAGTWGNLRCLNGAIQGVSNNIALTARSGTAGSLSDSSTTCTITGSGSANQTCSDTSNIITTTAGQIITLKIVTPATLTANARVNCSLEKLS